MASQRKSVHSRPGQTESQVDPSSQLASSPFDQGFFTSSLLSILVYSLKGGYVVYGGHGADVLTFAEIRK